MLYSSDAVLVKRNKYHCLLTHVSLIYGGQKMALVYVQKSDFMYKV